jgi:hypothetical protein
MTEAEWFEDSDPQDMWEFVHDKVSVRRMRLFACASVRASHWRLPAQDSANLLQVVDRQERFADGLLSPDALPALRDSHFWMRELNVSSRDARFLTDSWITDPDADMLAGCASVASEADPDDLPPREVRHLLRDVFGNPFRPVSVDPLWRTPVVVGLARAAYGERSVPGGHLSSDRLAILADALEDAGCVDRDALDHLRRPGPHVRGCWPLDSVLARP